MIEVIRNIEQNKRRLRDQNTEIASAALTAYIGATTAITTAGYIIPWVVVFRNQAITVSSNIFINIPTAGYYSISLPVRLSAANLWLRCGILLSTGNTAAIQTQSTPVGSLQTNYFFNFMRYFPQGETVRIVITPQINCNYVLTGESAEQSSGFVNVVQLSGAIE